MSLLETVLNAVSDDRLRTALDRLRVLWFNGEVVTQALRERALTVLPPTTRLLNTYSISECHDVASLDLRRMAAVASEFCPVGFANQDVDARSVELCAAYFFRQRRSGDHQTPAWPLRLCN